MKLLIVGGGIGGLATALCLHRAGIDVDIYEQAQVLHELGVGINMLPHAVKELTALGLLPALDEAGIRTRELIFANRLGQVVWRERRGIDAGYEVPQLSIHRGKLLGVLLGAVLDRIGASRLHTDRRLIDFREGQGRITATFESRSSGERHEAVGEGLIGADGIHSRVRDIFYPDEGPPRWSGMLLWRGATSWPVCEDGHTMVIAGGNAAKFVFYPIHLDPLRPAVRMTNWAVMARIGDGTVPPPRREDWNRAGRLEEALGFVQDRFRLGFIAPAEIIEATGTFYEYPNCDRDPVPRWSSGRATLLGDAAHPMYPVGSNGASQAILDAASVARHLVSTSQVEGAFAAYDAERRPATADIVRTNRCGGPEGVIDLGEARAPQGFDECRGRRKLCGTRGDRARLRVNGWLHARAGQPWRLGVKRKNAMHTRTGCRGSRVNRLPPRALRLIAATDADVPSIVALMNLAFRSGGADAGWTTEADCFEGNRTSEAMLRGDIATNPEATMLVWRQPDGAPLGCVWVGPQRSDVSYLGSLTIDPREQNRGLGRQLLAAAENWILRRGGQAIRMTVINVRDSLLAWYARRGYLPTGETKAFPYGDHRFGIPKRDDLHFVVLRKRF